MSTLITSAPGDVMLRRNAEVGLAIAVVFIIALLVIPLPAILLDLLLALSIGLSVVILLVALYTVDPLEFSAFPALLLLLTLFRLALNVASTRLILGEGDAGSVIQAFGEFVIGGNYAVGLILFLILVGINFIVITKGTGRVAEVAARFTLDAMPGKQMSIDADLNAGIIDKAEARLRRENISRQADFYGSMDGASKFVKGDAIACLLITGINIVGGIFIGVVQRGLPVGRSVSTYTILTVGDGLVSQIPALLVSTAAGIMVTHASGGSRMGAALANQVGSQPRAMWIAAGVMIAFGLIPGLPALPFLALGGGIMLVARSAGRSEKRRIDSALAGETAETHAPETDSPLRHLLQIDPVEVEVGYALIDVVDEGEGGDLLRRISLLRKQAAVELGILVPPVRIRDDIRLPANEYVIKLRGVEIARGEVMPRLVLALDAGEVPDAVEGIETVDPSGMPARWVAPSRRAEAESFGYAVVEPAGVIASHLLEMLKANAGDLLGRQDVKEMMDALRESHPALVEDVIPGKVSIGTLHRVLQRLLEERVPIRDMVTILEALGDAAEQTKDPEALTEHVRRALGHVIGRLHMDRSGVVHGIIIGPRLEASLMSLLSPRIGHGVSSLLDQTALANLLRELGRLAGGNGSNGRVVPLIAPPSLRIGIRRLIEPVLPAVPVLSLAELPSRINLETIATWELPMTTGEGTGA